MGPWILIRILGPFDQNPATVIMSMQRSTDPLGSVKDQDPPILALGSESTILKFVNVDLGKYWVGPFGSEEDPDLHI